MLIIGITSSGRILTIAPTGRGSASARIAYLNSLDVNKTFEWLFEGGDPSYRDGNPLEPDFDDVAIQMLFNGGDGTTIFDDESSFVNAITRFGDTQIDTAQSMFGGSSCLFDGTGDQLFQSDTARWELGSEEWTFELWVRFNGDPGAAEMQFLNKYVGGSKSYEFYLLNNELVGNFSTDGSADINMFTETWNPAGDTWYHLAFCRDNSATDTVRVFVDGTQLGSGNTAVDGNTFFNGTSNVRIGVDESAAAGDFNGWMDDFRLTVGTARYTANFTVPEQLPRGARTLNDTGAIDPAFSQSQLSFASVDSIKFEHGANEGLQVNSTTTRLFTNNFAFELWYQQEDYDEGIDQFNNSEFIIPMIGNTGNATRYLGRTIRGVVGQAQEITAWPSSARTGADGWSSFVDTYGDDTPHQLMEIHQVASRDDYIAILDGVPIGAGSVADESALINWDNSASGVPQFNGRTGLADFQRPGSQFGSFTMYDNGEEFTLQKVRELFELSALDGHDMLTFPGWVELDAENVTVTPFTLRSVLMGDVTDATGIRSGAIPRTGKIYFEMEILAEGDSTSACRVGIRRMITIADVGDVTDASEDGDGHHIYVDGDDLFSDDGTDLGIDISTTSTGMATGTTAMFAIDWNTGKLWIGRDGVFGDNGGDPENGTSEIFTIDTTTNWAAHVWNSGADGNGEIRLKCRLGEMKFTPPVGFNAWTNNFVAEAGTNGVNNRLLEVDRMGVQKDREYLFEGVDTTTYRFDSNETTFNFAMDEGAGATTDRVLGGTQISHASPDSVTWGRASDNPYVNNSGLMSAGNNAHTWEFWYRQPDFSGDAGYNNIAILIGGTGNTRIIIGKADAAINAPCCRNNFNNDLKWESEVETYGDNKFHQLMEIHESAFSANYFVTLDGMPIADGTNTGWFGLNGSGNRFNADLNLATGFEASGGDFGSYHQYRGGVPPTLYDVRRLYEASALDGNDMLTSPRWFILDSVNCTVADVVAGDGKDLLSGTVDNDTGARSGAIPRNGKVYFELEIIVQGEGTGTSNLGPRKLAEESNVGDFPDIATDGYHTDGQGAIHDSDEVSIGITGTLGTAAVGRIFQIAIDWFTGDWWMGTDNTLWAGIGGTGNPSTNANPLTALDIEHNWAMGMNILNTFGGSTVRLITASSDLNFAAPTAYLAWEDVGTDPHFASIVLLLPLNGVDEATSTTDLSNEAHTITFNGTAELDTAQAKFGTSSVLFSLGDFLTAPDDASFTLGNGDFTLETHIRFNALPSASVENGHCMMAHYENDANQRSWFWAFTDGGEMDFFWSSNGTTTESVVSTDLPALSTGVWYHVAMVRDGSTVRLFFDGIELATTGDSISTTTLHDSNQPLRIGAVDSSVGFRRFTDGWLDNIRMTVGVTRYTSDFTPPTEEYPTS